MKMTQLVTLYGNYNSLQMVHIYHFQQSGKHFQKICTTMYSTCFSIFTFCNRKENATD